MFHSQFFKTNTNQTVVSGWAKWGANATLLPQNNTQTTDGAGWLLLFSDLKFRQTQIKYTESDET